MCRIIDIACCIAMVLISLKICLIVFFGILNFFSKIFIEEMCVVALASVVWLIFLVFLVIVCGKNLSL